MRREVRVILNSILPLRLVYELGPCPGDTVESGSPTRSRGRESGRGDRSILPASGHHLLHEASLEARDILLGANQ